MHRACPRTHFAFNRMTAHPPPPAVLELAPGEQARGLLSPAHLQQAVMLLACNGYVILRGALPRSFVDEMHAAYRAIVEDCLANTAGKSAAALPWRSAGDTVFWIINARLRAFVRLTGPFADTRVVANPFALAILRQTLGHGLFCNSVSSDTCLQGSVFQSPHRDIGFYAGKQALGTIVNIPLMHCGPHNGPLQVWPGGSHLWNAEAFARFGVRAFDQDTANPSMEAFARQVPSVALDLHPGDVLLRDPGMLHRGTPNTTPEPRSMLTIGYFRAGQRYEFGHPEYNLTPESFEALHPRVKALVAQRYLAGTGSAVVRR
jgi:ectoine hydroxylase-related dioxygenase (phytanoyl-CoA dioxygenase family)